MHPERKRDVKPDTVLVDSNVTVHESMYAPVNEQKEGYNGPTYVGHLVGQLGAGAEAANAAT
jgi:hypothetical protein